MPSDSSYYVLGDARDAYFAEVENYEGLSNQWRMEGNTGRGRYTVLDRNEGNTEILPGYTVFGASDSMRIFSFPKGTSSDDVQSQLSEWYAVKGASVEIRVKVEGELEEDLVLIVVEGVDSTSEVVIIEEK